MIDPRQLAPWHQRCQALGLTLTAPRRAILRALLAQAQAQAQDAVQLLLAAREHYPATSQGTVYRFLRELENHHLVQPVPQPHGRLLWRLQATTAPAVPLPDTDLLDLLRQLARRLGYRLEPV